ncbi:MAG: hypothetical protein M3421_13005, partial [Bacteroidota bacterium]|nr:hypothetical protein [Bacteroidota bacterium]
YLAGLDNVIAIGVFQNEQVEAVSLFAYTDYVAEYLFNVSLPQGQKYTVPLIWHAIHQLKALNIPFLNLGGGVSENDSIAQFKERFGAEKLDLTALNKFIIQLIMKCYVKKVYKMWNIKVDIFLLIEAL